MHCFIRQRRHRSSEIEAIPNCNEHPRFSHATWGAIAVAAVGVGTSLYGANAQKKAQGAANANNQASVDNADRSAWVNYLLTRGIAADQNTPTGTIPTNGRAVNTRLPLWANMSTPAQPKRGGFLTPRA